MHEGRALRAAVLALLLCGCGGERPAGGPAVPGAPGAGAPLSTALPSGPCPAPAPPVPADVRAGVEGLVLPDGAVLTEVVRQGPLVQLRGFVERTPLQLRAEYEQRDDVEVLTLEDEVVEVETLVSDGAHRTYLRGTAVCATASRLDGLVSVETG